MQKLSLPIQNMTCIHCALRVEQRLRKVPGVSKASVNLKAKVAFVEFDLKVTSVGGIIYVPIYNFFMKEWVELLREHDFQSICHG